MNNMPGFTAEASLYKKSGCYAKLRAAACEFSDHVLPQAYKDIEILMGYSCHFLRSQLNKTADRYKWTGKPEYTQDYYDIAFAMSLKGCWI